MTNGGPPAHQVTCALYGLHAESLVQHREVGQVTLLEALAAIDKMEQQDLANPQTRALGATLRKLALLVYESRSGRATTRMSMPSRNVYARRRNSSPATESTARGGNIA